jgi:hypothetical protein
VGPHLGLPARTTIERIRHQTTFDDDDDRADPCLWWPDPPLEAGSASMVARSGKHWADLVSGQHPPASGRDNGGDLASGGTMRGRAYQACG